MSPAHDMGLNIYHSPLLFHQNYRGFERKRKRRFSFQLSKSLGNTLSIIKALRRKKSIDKLSYEKDGIFECGVLMSFWT